MIPRKMKNNYTKFYETNWEQAYSFWHKIINRGEKQIRTISKIIKAIDSKPIRILDVGCGEGDETYSVLSKFKNKKFEITANDTSDEALKRYKHLNLRYLRKSINKRLEKLPAIINNKFDLIIFLHCLYEANLNGLLRKYLGTLNENGVIVIFLDSEFSGIKNIQKKFWPAVYGKTFDENTAESLLDTLTREKIKFKYTSFSYNIYLNKLKNIDNNGVTSLLIPFVMRKKGIKKNDIDEIMAYIDKIQKYKQIPNKTLSIIIRKREN